MRFWLVLLFVLTAYPAAYCQTPLQAPNESPEEQRFKAAKKSRERDVIWSYVAAAKRKVEKEWRPEIKVKGELAITKVRASIDVNGRVTSCKVLGASRFRQQDEAVSNFVRSLSFTPLPAGLKSLDVFWTFMSDGTMNMVEYSQSHEADKYHSDLLGGPLTTWGGLRGNPDANNNPNGRPSLNAQKDVDFGPYMADLQRRIKRAWFPPKGNESKRVVVQFKIHRGGNLSDLRLDHSSGLEMADQAALKAVNDAAPFRPLPSSAPDHVDIQFTFDFNLFGGGGHGVFRSF